MLAEDTRGLSPLETRRVETHIENCTACQALLCGEADTPPTADLLRRHPAAAPTLEEWARVEAALAEVPLQSSPEPAGSWRLAGPLAAAILVSVILLWFFHRPAPFWPSGNEYVAEVSVDILEVSEESQVMIELPEGESDAIMVWISSG
jgi:hypothetical protein